MRQTEDIPTKLHFLNPSLFVSQNIKIRINLMFANIFWGIILCFQTLCLSLQSKVKDIIMEEKLSDKDIPAQTGIHADDILSIPIHANRLE